MTDITHVMLPNVTKLSTEVTLYSFLHINLRFIFLNNAL